MLGRLDDFFGGERKEQYGSRGPAIGRVLSRQQLLNARFGIAAQHAGAVTGHRA